MLLILTRLFVQCLMEYLMLLIDIINAGFEIPVPGKDFELTRHITGHRRTPKTETTALSIVQLLSHALV